MQPPSSPELQEATASRRNLLKCERCRHDKKKCILFQRDDPNMCDQRTEKCKRCFELGYECGSLQANTRKMRHKRSIAELNPQRHLSCSKERYTVFETPSGGSSPVCNFEAKQILSMPIKARTSTFDQLATILAARQILLRCQSDIRFVGEKVGIQRQDEDGLFQIVHERLRREFNRIVVFAKSELEALRDWNKEDKEAKMNLWLYKERILQYQQLLINSNYSEALAQDRSIVVPIPNSVFDEFEVMLCTANVMIDLRTLSKEGQHSRNNTILRGGLEDYVSAAGKLSRLFDSVAVDVAIPAHYGQGEFTQNLLCKLRNGFPAPHLAFWNRNTTAAIQLWKSSRRRGELRDPFGRTFAHVVTETGDLETLDCICQSSGSYAAFRNAGLDDRGMSLLAITAMTGDRDSFTYFLRKGLHKCGEVKAAGQPLLELAIASGSKAIVERLLEEGIAFLLASHVIMAIDKGQEEIAVCFVNELTIRNRLSSRELTNLAKMACSKRMFKLEYSIKSACDTYKGHADPMEEIYCTPHVDMLGFTSENAYFLDSIGVQTWLSPQSPEISMWDSYNPSYHFIQ